MGDLTIADFLRARLDEDEAAARDAGGDRWHIGNAVDPTTPCNVHTLPGARGVAEECGWLHAEHIIRHDPARTLRRVQAHRKILDEHAMSTIYAFIREGPYCYADEGAYPCLTLRLLAQEWDDHPDYREEWRP